MDRRWAVLVLVVAGLAMAQEKPKPLTEKESKDVKFFVLQANGQPVEVERESPNFGTESGLMGGGRSSPSATTVTLTGGKAKLRFREGDPMQLWVMLPEGINLRSVNLFKFESRGKRRVTYTTGSAFPIENTLSFKGQKTADGKWRVEPSAALPRGEYCYEARDLFCFGVDKK